MVPKVHKEVIYLDLPKINKFKTTFKCNSCFDYECLFIPGVEGADLISKTGNSRNEH